MIGDVYITKLTKIPKVEVGRHIEPATSGSKQATMIDFSDGSSFNIEYINMFCEKVFPGTTIPTGEPII